MTRRLVALLSGAVLALTGCSDVSGTGSKGYVTGDGSVTEVAVDDRAEPIELEGEDLEGGDLSLAELTGKPVVVNVWWSGCPPCRLEQPDLNEAAAEIGDDATFVGVNIRDASPEQGQAYVRSNDVPYPSFYSPDGKALLAFDGTLGPRTVPATVVLDAEGRMAASIIGTVPSAQTLVDLVAQVSDE